jgi:competence protein ComEC
LIGIEFTQANPMLAWIFGLRNKALTTLHTIFPSPEADLLAGILLGMEQGLSPGLQEAFRLTGTTHIIAISGFNIAIIAGLFSGILTRLLGRKWGAVTAIVGITGYTILVGGDAAVVRAAIMGGLGTIGGMFGRRQNGLNSLGLAVFGMVLINPNIPWDISFQLSVSATLGLILYAQPLEERFVKISQRWISEEQAQRIAGPCSQVFLFTLAAQVMTLPLMAYHFGGISWAALIANPLILPVQAMVLILGGLAVVGGLILPGLGHILAVPALPFVRYTIRMVSWISGIPGADLSPA